MFVIVLGLGIALVTQLGIPSSWKMLAVALAGLGVGLLGFLLRGEALGRAAPAERSRTSFVESPAPQQLTDRVDGITSLN